MSFIQNLFTSRDNNANASTYVGQQDRIWWNPTTNSFYYSDGNTAGGIAIGSGGNPFNQVLNTYNDATFANLTVTGNLDADLGNISNIANLSVLNTANLGNLSIQDETIYGLIADRDIVLDPAGNGVVNINGPFHVHSGNLTADPIFQVAIDGRVKTLVPNTNSYNGAFNIVGSTDGAEVAPQNLGVMLHATGQATIPSRIYNDGVANYAAVINRRYNGISSAPTGVLQNQIIGRLGATPYLVDDTWPTISTTRLDMVALEDQSTTAQGSAIKLYTVASGATSPTLTADFIVGQLTMSGNLNPALTSTYTLGNAANQWQGVYLGNSGVYIKDVVTGNNAQIQANASVLTFANINALRLGNLSYTTTGIYTANSAQNIIIGNVGDTGNTVINNAGIKFTDGSVQTTAGIPLTQKGAASGVVPLNASTKIDPIYLPSGAITFKGVWNASNNTPTLADGTGTNGDEYVVGVAGTQNLGSGNITFAVGDFVLYTSANVWVDIPVGATGVQSFNGRDGVVTLQSGDVTNALSAGSITNSYLANTGINITYSGGLSGNASVNLGGTLALTNSGVTGITAGTGVSVSGNTGNVTVSIGQAVGTANSVSFQSVSSTTTIAATGNITGGNLNTGGQIIAIGNILTSGLVSAGGNILTSGLISATGNATAGNLITAGLVSATGTITATANISGGNILTGGLISATGNIRGGNVSIVGNTTTANLTITGTSNLNSNANVKISGGTNGQQLTTDGAGNLSWSFAQAGNTIIQTGANTTVNVDFSTNSLHLLYLPTGPVSIGLSNYTAGAQGRVIIRFGTPYTVNMGVANVQQTTEGLTTIPISGGGGHKISGNQSVQLLYTCYDNTAGNCYVASTFL